MIVDCQLSTKSDFRRWGDPYPRVRVPIIAPNVKPRPCWNQPESIFMAGGYTPARNAPVSNLITNTDQYPSNGMTECGKDCRDCEQSARVEDVGKI